MIVVPLTLAEANNFVLSFHRHNRPTAGGKWAIGASTGEELVGVAIVGRPIARLLNDDFTVEVLRLCTNETAPKGTCGFLYSRCWKIWREMGGRRIVTYTLQTESGASLRGAGYRVLAEVRSGGWNRTGREREWYPVYGQLKLRWEKSV